MQEMTFKEYIQEAKNDSENIQKEYEVPEYNYDFLMKRIEKLNKAGRKLKLDPITVTVISRRDHIIKKKQASGEEIAYKKIPMVKVSLEGSTPKFVGWSFLGKLEPIGNGESGVLVKSAPGLEIPRRYRNADGIHCEHCGIDRRRRASYIVKKGKTVKEVGRSCLKDFLGHGDPEKIADWATVLYDITKAFADEQDLKSEEDFGGNNGPRAIPVYDVKRVLAASFVSIKGRGFVSKNNAYISDNPPTTFDLASHFFDDKGDKLNITPDDEERAKAAMTWIETEWGKPSATEFQCNVAKMVKAGFVSSNNFGYIAAAANSYNKMEEEKKEREALAAGKTKINDAPFGVVGDKNKINGVVLSSTIYNTNSYSRFAPEQKSILVVKSDKNHLIKMFTSNIGFEPGDKVVISGKIGRHEQETFNRSKFFGMTMTIMAPGSRIKSADE